MITREASLIRTAQGAMLQVDFKLLSAIVGLFLSLVTTVIRLEKIAAEESPPNRFTLAEPNTPLEQFGLTIRSTSFRTPSEELAGFHVPTGFQVELIASEPAISKPMNMAFDAQGRLWITQSTQYPFPAKADEIGTDAVVILEDKDHDGKFETTRTFADGLNIPIGLLPYGDGVLCFSIPNILYLRDKDHDGVCDTREILLGPFDTTRDTHGMVNSMRLGADGWVYACHGFNNQSTVQGKDGHSVSMTSGNVFRFRPDSSRVELFTQGQVNPFGMSQDKWGFWYAADCHSKPISQLIRGGCYPSFGRPDDGLGFVPPMMEHLHGSTAISGLAHSKDSRFPKDFDDNFFSGNVMSCRINRNQLTYRGSTAKAVAMPDLLTSDDPWFRPVDLQFGPDGCLYVADFYNKVIGHYEVPLDHPDRDRKSGRIWRIRWESHGENANVYKAVKRSEQTLAELESEVESANLEEVADAILARNNLELIGLRGNEKDANWLLGQSLRVNSQIDPVLYQTLLISIRDIATRIRVSDTARFQGWVTDACSGIGLPTTREPQPNAMDTPPMRALTRVLLALKDEYSIAGVLSICERQISISDASSDQRRIVEECIQSVAEVIDESNMARFFALLDATTQDEDTRADQLLRIARRQLQQRGKVLESLALRCQELAGALAGKWLSDVELLNSDGGDFQLVNWAGKSSKNDERKDWPSEKRAFASDKAKPSKMGIFFSSLPLGETYTGTWSSSPFIAKGQFVFHVVGHNGLPSNKSTSKNFVSLVRLDEVGNVAEELCRAFPPRSDNGHRVEWNMQKYEGAMVQLRVVDADSDASYAWIGVGEFSCAGFSPGSIRDKWERIRSLVALCGFPSKVENLKNATELLSSEKSDWTSRYRLHRLRNRNASADVVELVDFALEQNWNDLLALMGIQSEKSPSWDWEIEKDSFLKFGEAICKRCTYQDQERLVLRLSRHRSALELVATLCERGSLSRDALRVLPKSWWEGLPEESKPRFEMLRPETTGSSSRLDIVEGKASTFASLAVDLQVGAKQFADRCATCHKLGDQGKIVGPQLEGVGARGLVRLCEDILWPDRNVDEAFKMTMMVLAGGESVSGLVSDRTAESLLLTDQTGKQRRVLLSDIEQEKPSKLSLMPGNFDELMTDAELASLIGYLRSSILRKVTAKE